MPKSVTLPRVMPTQDPTWTSLVNRSIATWNDFLPDELLFSKDFHNELLREYRSLDEFLAESPKSVTLWFFQIRNAFMSQNRFRKWSREVLDDYVLLPAALGYVQRRDCFFISHF
ncbi:hypothetical protein GGP41_003295 [Bipolaris sorokiniana]|uniref:Uncharacterized protein n=1 Tax=Cochliobolus sativus TaxID=45130 RepID=A0A8H5ZFR3_COCSA|nr:hypothetical protein GGP41_003295 [Bipolaris sorokiniana]